MLGPLALLLLTPQASTLVDDIDDAIVNPGSTPFQFRAASDGVVFGAVSNLVETLWSSDGSAGGTSAVAPQLFRPRYLLEADGRVFFHAENGNGHFRAFSTDGLTVEPVSQMVFSEADGTFFIRPAVYDGELYFAGDDGVSTEFWSSDGTLAGTGPVTSLFPGGDAHPAPVGVFEGDLFFLANDSANKTMLLRYDAAQPNDLTLVKAFDNLLIVSTGPGVVFEGALYFGFAGGDGNGLELWRTDGTDAGTELAVDVSPVSSTVRDLQLVQDHLVFRAGGTDPVIYTSDGTPSGTEPLGPYTEASQTAYLPDGRIAWFADGPQGRGLVVSDGTVGGTSMELTVANDRRIVSVSTGVVFITEDTEHELWFTDGTALGTVLLSSDVSYPELSTDGTDAWFVANDEPWITDGTLAGTRQVADIQPPVTASANPVGLFRFGKELLLSAETLGQGRELWRVPEGGPAVLIDDFAPGTAPNLPAALVDWRGEAYVTFDDPASGAELFATDGTPGGTRLVKDIEPGPGDSSPTEAFALGDRILFRATTTAHGAEPWVTDGTDAGTQLLVDLAPGALGSLPTNFTRFADLVLFSARDQAGSIFDTRVWRTDGTAAGTVPVSPALQSDQRLVDCGEFVAFHVFGFGLSNGVWRTDGTPAGTFELLAEPPTGSVAPIDGNAVFLIGVGSAPGLYTSDGTVAGTQRYLDLEAQGWTLIQTADGLVGSGDLAYFFARTGATDRTLFVTDGTAAGTAPLRAFDNDSGQRIFALGGGLVMLRADDGASGLEPWVSDGTVAGTARVSDIAPGPASSLTTQTPPVVVGRELYFRANDTQVGEELHGVSLAGFRMARAAAIGTGCSTTGFFPELAAPGDPSTGGAFELRITDATASVAALPYVGTELANDQLFDGCNVYVAGSIFALPLIGIDATGNGERTFQVPADPSLAGALIYLQAFTDEAGGPILGSLAATNAIEVLIGN